MRRILITFALILTGLLAVTGCGGAAPVEPTATTESTRPEPPEEYNSLANPYAGDIDAETEGESLYLADCSSCHGPAGRGDGPAAGGLDPKPQNLAENQDFLSDAYLYWRISEGGLMEPFYSVMPSWAGILNEEQIWQIISFLRTLGG
jgi:mono/diheme cytochrome c family protein